MKLAALGLLLLAIFAGLIVYINRTNEVAAYEFCAQFSSGNAVERLKTQAAAEGFEMMPAENTQLINFGKPVTFPFASQFVCQVVVNNNKVEQLVIVKLPNSDQ